VLIAHSDEGEPLGYLQQRYFLAVWRPAYDAFVEDVFVVEAARGRYLVVLHDDTVVADGWLQGLIDWSLADWPRTGLVGPCTDSGPGMQQVGAYPDGAEANAAREAGEARVILFGLCGHGHFDLGAYEAYFAGKLENYELPQERLDAALAELPAV